MAKTHVEKRVEQALQTLIAPREDSIRALAQALEDIASVDSKIAELTAQRDQLISTATQATTDAKTAGWKPKELAAAGLLVPRRTTTHRPTTDNSNSVND